MAVQFSPKDPTAYNNRGGLLAVMGKQQLAIADFTQAIRLHAKNASAYRNRGLAHHELGETAQARSDFATALRLEPGAAERIPVEYRKQ